MTIAQAAGPRRIGGFSSRKQRRLLLIALAGVVLAVAVGLILYAMSDKVTFFSSPTEVLATPPSPMQRIRLGGLVANGTIVHEPNGIVTFDVTDGAKSIPVSYQGIVPDLFREGQGVITEGVLGPDGRFTADTLLAKHDETYMPADVVSELKASGEWYGDDPTAPATGANPAGVAAP